MIGPDRLAPPASVRAIREATPTRCPSLVWGTWENKTMQRQRGELVPIGDALADLGGPVKAIRDASPQALHHFTQADQVNQLVEASEADPDLGFMGRTMALCSLPRSNPGNRKEYKGSPHETEIIVR